MLENLSVKGSVKIEVHDENGVLKEEHFYDNLVVTTGRSYVTSRMKDASATVMSHIGIGTGAVSPATGDTTLGAEQGTRVASTVTQVTTTTANDTIQYVSQFIANNPATPQAITEAGIFNASTVGTMLSRVTFAAINKAIADTLTITWQIKAN